MGQGVAQILVFVVILIAAAYPFGLYMSRVFADGDASRHHACLRDESCECTMTRREASAALL